MHASFSLLSKGIVWLSRCSTKKNYKKKKQFDKCEQSITIFGIFKDHRLILAELMHF